MDSMELMDSPSINAGLLVQYAISNKRTNLGKDYNPDIAAPLVWF
ncbi:unnamed protein product [Strongylus vulgaris]|uniref:Uncharacterized protein n=1 Tax=Strongylus vulgaris TaxID=40348 RepID=A0A3P7IL68_STRVU|nr:unnamed protein product [Strongylus vulgaris]